MSRKQLLLVASLVIPAVLVAPMYPSLSVSQESPAPAAPGGPEIGGPGVAPPVIGEGAVRVPAQPVLSNDPPVGPGAAGPIVPPARVGGPAGAAVPAPTKAGNQVVWKTENDPDSGVGLPLRLLYLKHVSAESVREILTSLVPETRGMLAVDARSNLLIVRAPDERFSKMIESLAETMDAAEPVVNRPAAPPTTSPMGTLPGFGGPPSNFTGTLAINVPATATELRKKYEVAERATHDLATVMRRDQSEQTRRDELRHRVSEAFVARQQVLRAELKELQDRLNATQQSIELRDRVADQIIDRRTAELLDPNLKWDAGVESSRGSIKATVPGSARQSAKVSVPNPSIVPVPVSPSALPTTVNEVELVLKLGYERDENGSPKNAFPTVLYDGRQVEVANLTPELERERRLLERLIGKDDLETAAVLIQVEPGIPEELVQQLIKKCRDNGYSRISLWSNGPDAAPMPASVQNEDQKKPNWNDSISNAQLKEEVKKIRNRVAASYLASVGTYNGNNKAIAVDGAVMAALASIVIEQESDVSWKANAPFVRDCGFELSKAATGLGMEKYMKSKTADEKLRSLLSGTVPADALAAAPDRPFHEVADRALLMKRIDRAKNWLRDNVNREEKLDSEADAILHEAAIISTLARIIATDGYSGTDENEYQQFAKDLNSGVREASSSVKDRDLQKFKDGMIKVSRSCNDCHANYGN